MTLPAGAFRMVRPLTVLGLSFGLLCSAGTAASAGTAGSAGLAGTAGSAGRTVPAGPALSGVPAAKGTGWLQLAHLSPNTPAVDVYLYSFGKAHAMIVLKHVSYGTVSPYEPVRSGEYTVAMRSAGASPRSKPVLSTSVAIAAGHAYTVAGMGPLSGLRLEVLRDRLTTPRGQALVRVIQASLQQHQVTVTAGKHVLAAKEAFAKVSSYQVVRPGMWTVRAAGASENASARIRLAAGSIHTIVILDRPGHLSIASLEDAAGSRVVPLGGAQTGFGGTVARPAASPVPWLVTLAAGLILALAGASRLRRSRRVTP